MFDWPGRSPAEESRVEQCDVTETVRRVRGEDGGSDHADEQSCTGGCSIYSKSPAEFFVVRVLHACACV